VGNTQYDIPFCVQPSIAVPIFIRPQCMLATIDLNNDPTLKACEVDNIRTDRLLSPELKSTKLPASQFSPKNPLGEARQFS